MKLAIAYLYEEEKSTIAITSLLSLTKHTDYSGLKIFLLHKKIPLFSRELLHAHFPIGLEIEWIELPEETNQEIAISFSAFSHLEKIIPQYVETLALLQGLLFFRTSIYELLHLRPNKVAMVRNKYNELFMSSKQEQKYWEQFSTSSENIFFNPNVTLIDMNYWRRESLSIKLKAAYEKMNREITDFSFLINYGLKDVLELLPEAWNCQYTEQELKSLEHCPETIKKMKIIQLIQAQENMTPYIELMKIFN